MVIQLRGTIFASFNHGAQFQAAVTLFVTKFELNLSLAKRFQQLALN